MLVKELRMLLADSDGYLQSSTMVVYEKKVHDAINANLRAKTLGDDIGTYLAPLIEDLKILWENGVECYDAYREEVFNLRSVLLWTINDFPANGTLLDIPGKSEDGLNARRDLVDLKLRPDLAPISSEKKIFILPACYTLTKEEKRCVLKTLSRIKVPEDSLKLVYIIVYTRELFKANNVRGIEKKGKRKEVESLDKPKENEKKGKEGLKMNEPELDVLKERDLIKMPTEKEVVSESTSTLPLAMKSIPRYAEKVMEKDSSITFSLPVDLFGISRKSSVLREDIIDICNMNEVKMFTLVAYMM
ncbi:transposase [Cucumis melo var. makuwa]|uniref:Transposase n=1 Tax=Cucumis melo var. makuwa TaxID=1194695 RepID=A0A5D3E641_CUCMM|nr:transposase [Cucumis melo var. makuwa]